MPTLRGCRSFSVFFEALPYLGSNIDRFYIEEFINAAGGYCGHLGNLAVYVHKENLLFLNEAHSASAAAHSFASDLNAVKIAKVETVQRSPSVTVKSVVDEASRETSSAAIDETLNYMSKKKRNEKEPRVKPQSRSLKQKIFIGGVVVLVILLFGGIIFSRWITLLLLALWLVSARLISISGKQG